MLSACSNTDAASLCETNATYASGVDTTDLDLPVPDELNVAYMLSRGLASIADSDYRGLAARHVICSGGGACIPGFHKRLETVRVHYVATLSRGLLQAPRLTSQVLLSFFCESGLETCYDRNSRDWHVGRGNLRESG